jgi:hypothetical protein
LEAKAVKLKPPVFVDQEDLLALVAALGDAMRDARPPPAALDGA